MHFWILPLFLLIVIQTVIEAQINLSNKEISDNDVGKFALSPEPFARSTKINNYNNNHKPMFDKCNTYKPEVEEQQEKGKFVIRVEARDNDPKETGGTVTYKIVQRDGERVYFTINNQTGDVRTNAEFDRDEPNRQKELYVTVQATDNGRPPLADICTFKVTITDINDNPPSFDASDYTVHIAEDLAVNKEVVRIFAYDLDDGENSRLTYTLADNPTFNEYFRINQDTGVLYLKKNLHGQSGLQFTSSVSVHDNGQPQHSSNADLKITVVGSDTQSPRINILEKELDLDENFHDFEKALVHITAESNIQDKEVRFELVKGKTTQTNKDQTFQLKPDASGTSASIYLGRALDYETVTEYQLTVRVHNKLQHSAPASDTIMVKVKDVNDEIPTFIELLKGSVVENDEVGAQAMQVRAIDKDGTSANNIVSYKLLSHEDVFDINPETGVITAKTTFDRENVSVYHVTVRAYDNSPSALLHNGEPNSADQTFQITIEDRNDNKPMFTQSIYVVHNISERADKFSFVIEVKAIDKDTASEIVYSIIDGNTDGAFEIENSTGRIRVMNHLDYEKIESYNLTVSAFDSVYEDRAKVIIYIQNENDEPPEFDSDNFNVELEEERVVDGCIKHVKATDPDIKNKTADQRIVYAIDGPNEYLNVTKDGCVHMIKALDRDRPNGSPSYQFFILAYDDDGGPNSLSSHVEMNINLKDINDNAPFLSVTQVKWNENQPPGKIGMLTADDYDSVENGPPFEFEMDSVDGDIFTKFSISANGELSANVQFDREEKKYYEIPVRITDSGKPRQSGVSVLTVIIGDENDNEAQSGSSEIFVYKYEKLQNDIEIGRVYVTDPDDWDLNDKTFQFDVPHENFYLSYSNNGMIVMRHSAQEGFYVLKFQVTEAHPPNIMEHTVDATVNVTIKEIPEEAVRKSGSIRMKGSSIEEFISKEDTSAFSKKDILQRQIAQFVNTSIENVDVFTVLPTPSNSSYIDVRFSAHGSPYYAPEKLNSKAIEQEDKLQKTLGVDFVMIGISECLSETACSPGSSCSNVLEIKDEPAVVFTNKTSFVGVKAMVEKNCNCMTRTVTECFNGGTPLESGTCSCPEGAEGEHCEILGIGFTGAGWALYPTLDACNRTQISLSILSERADGLIFYVGPETYKHAVQLSKDFMSLELRDGYLVLKLDFGHGSTEVVSNYKRLNDGAMHRITISYTTEDIQLIVDECPSDCLSWLNIKGLLNVNGPLQLGGMKRYFPEEQSKMLWQNFSLPTQGFSGCIRNFTVNDFQYNLGQPAESHDSHINCRYGVMEAVTFGIDSNFLVAILVCIAILIILLLAVVVHRRKQDNLNEKDVDDTRENIINYEDEGGGEYDTNFDLSLLRQNQEEKPPIKYKPVGDIPADINSFLETKKDACDKDPNNLPYDDVRYYAYEGDGNSTGSLSSLASCTDEGDLKFNYLSDFGPRFRKLADMYGEDPSDDSSQEGGEESYC